MRRESTQALCSAGQSFHEWNKKQNEVVNTTVVGCLSESRCILSFYLRTKLRRGQRKDFGLRKHVE